MYYIPKESNTRADLLSKLASTKKNGHFKTIIREMLQTLTIDTEEVMAEEEEELDWMNPYKNFLIWRVLLSDENKAQRLNRKASYYVILDGELFKRGLTISLLKCLNSQQANYIMKDLHEGICGLYTFIQGDTPLPPKWCVPATIGRYSWLMPLISQRDADDAKSLQTLRAPLLAFSTAWPFTM